MPPSDRPVDPRDAELERLNRLKDDFLVTLSHELRTPMTVVLGWARTLLDGGLKQPFAHQAIEAIERNAQIQLTLINRVLDVSDIVQGRLRLAIEAVDLLALISEVVESVRPAAFARQITIAWAPVSERIVVAGDTQRLRQVAWHLLSNAVRFTAIGGRVTVRATRDDRCAQIQVSDNGIGIAPEFLPHVFEAFRQADASTRRQHGGLGLGLTIVRHLVELHGGQVTASSRGVGCGATFSVTLPVRAAVTLVDGKVAGDEQADAEGDAPCEATGSACKPAHGGNGGAGRSRAVGSGLRRIVGPGDEERADAGAAARLDGLTVLLVSADADARDLVGAILAESGACVRKAPSGLEALEWVEPAALPDVLIVDVGADTGDGYDLLHDLRAKPAEQGGRIPAIALTLGGVPREADRALAAGFQVHVAKPVFPGHLIDAVATLAGREVWS